jgi:hypothetical protein
MSQDFLQSSKFKFSSLSIDSRFADQNNGSTLDTTDFTIRLPETIKNIMRIRLSSVEIPPVEYTFSTEKGNVSGSIIDSTGTFPFLIASGNYSPESLAAAVQAVLPPSYTCVYSLTSQRISIRGPRDFTLQCGSPDLSISSRRTHWGLGYYLGFRTPFLSDRSITSISRDATAYAAPLVFSSSYYLMQLYCPDLLDSVKHRLLGNSEIPVFAKIILQAGNNGIEFDINSNDVWKEYTFLAPVNISQLRIRLLDPFGDPVRLHTSDWSMTFELTEIVNSRTYDSLNKTYSL